jgi:hypothetical protein
MYATDNTTYINGLGLGFAALMGLLMLVLPRRYAMLPVLAMVCYMTMGQRVIILGLNFTMIRLLLLCGFVRVFARGEVVGGKLEPIDRAMIWWVLASIVTYTLLWRSTEAFVNRLGLAYDALGLYLLFRVLVRDVDDMRRVVVQFAWLVIPLAVSMLVEKSIGRNPFSALGGVPPETIVREGVLRCQGPFAHPILAGAFGSALLPLFLSLWSQRGVSGLLVLCAIVSSGVIVWTAGSSGPLMAAALGMIGWWLFTLRRQMRAVRWTLGLTILALHLAMAVPVWFLLARVGVFGGSTGYHRAILIDHAVHRFSEWWLVGTQSTGHWGYYMFDITNQYVLVGVQGGLISLVLFVTIIVRCFAAVGRAVHEWGDAHRQAQKLAWGLGVSLLVHAVNYISVPYFDQNIVNWYLLLAMICTAGRIPGLALDQPATQKEKAGPDSGRRSRPSFREDVQGLAASPVFGRRRTS